MAPPTPPNPPVFDVALAAVTPNVDPGQAAPAAADDANTEPANPQSAAPPVNDAAPVAQLPQIQADGDGGNAPVPPPIMTAINPPAESRVDDAKPTAGKPAPVKTAADQPETTQNMQPPLAAADANMAAQLAMAVTPAANAPGATTAKTTGDAATQIASVASASIAKDNTSTSKAGTSAASPAAKGPQPATDATAKTEAPAAPAPPSAQAAIPASGKDATKDDGSAKSGNDGKPAHVAEAQPLSDIPAPLPQAAPAPILPQHLAVNGFGIQASAPATGNVQVTSSMVLANADPAPDMDALAVSVAARAMSGAKQFQIRLDPPELGRVDVRLSIDASGKTQAHMTADQPQTLDLLQKDATTLTQALRDAGLDVSQSGLNFSLRGQDRQNDDSNNGGARRTNLIATRAIQAVQSPNAISFNGAAADARVDIHV
ncbi:MAG: flagellar hook-length control protein FliK [Rhizomicrobium sp.]